MSSGTRTTPPTPKRSARRSPARPCASCRSSPSSSRPRLCRTGVRDLLIRQRTQLVNALRSHLAEFGIVGPQGLWNVKRLVDVVRDGGAPPAAARRALSLLVEQLESLGEQVAAIEKDIRAWHRQHEACRRLAAVPGIGPITASAIVATVPDLTMFSSGRDFAAWLGVTP